jgi:hypothetical protein
MARNKQQITKLREEPTFIEFKENLEPGKTYTLTVKTVSGKVSSWPTTADVTLSESSRWRVPQLHKYNCRTSTCDGFGRRHRRQERRRQHILDSQSREFPGQLPRLVPRGGELHRRQQQRQNRQPDPTDSRHSPPGPELLHHSPSAVERHGIRRELPVRGDATQRPYNRRPATPGGRSQHQLEERRQLASRQIRAPLRSQRHSGSNRANNSRLEDGPLESLSRGGVPGEGFRHIARLEERAPRVLPASL